MADGELTFVYPSDRESCEMTLPTVGCIASKRGGEPYAVGDAVTLRPFTNAEERNAAIAAALADTLR